MSRHVWQKFVCILVMWPALLNAAEEGSALGNIQTPRDTPVAFTELRMNALLEEPLEMRGELLYATDGELTKRIDTPIAELIVISDQLLWVEREDEVQAIPLRKTRGLGEFYVAMRALLDGDLDALHEQFQLKDLATGERWSVELVPRSRQLKKFAPLLVVTGSAEKLRSIELRRGANDWQTINLASGSTK